MKNILFTIFLFSLGLSYNGSITGLTYFKYQFSEDTQGFKLNRQYLNYEVDMAYNVKFKIILDAARTSKLTDSNGNKEDSRLVVFLKNAQLEYNQKWGTARFGLIATNTFNIQEINWGYRFIEKSAMDKNNFISTADLGIGLSRTINDNLDLNIQFLNGEGYKKSQEDKNQKLNFALNYGEKNISKNEGGNIGLVFSTEPFRSTTNNLISIYSGLFINNLRLAVESDFLVFDDSTQNLTSYSSTYMINSKVKYFIRHDILEQENVSNNQFTITGMIYDLKNGFILSPNIRSINHKNENYIYTLNFHFRF